MKSTDQKNILAERTAGEFVGRASELERLIAHALSAGGDDGLLLLSTPGAGATELLRQAYDRLFFEQTGIVPFYFAARKSDKSSRETAQRFLNDFIRQLIAFRRRDPALVRAAGGIEELSELSLPVGGYWIDRLVDMVRLESAHLDDRTFIRNCLAAPLRAAANGARSVVIFDSAHRLLELSSGRTFFAELKYIYRGSGVRFVIGGYRRFLYGRMANGSVPLDVPSFRDAGLIAESLAKQLGLELNEQSRDLIAAQIGGNPALIEKLLRSAAESGTALNSFQQVERAYADTVFGGRIARRFDAVFAAACRSREIEKRILRLLNDSQTAEYNRIELEIWQRRLQLEPVELDRVLEQLNIHEVVRIASGSIELMTENAALTDYINARFRLDVAAENRALVYGESLQSYIRRAPETMERIYRRNSSLGLREMLSAFDGQEIPLALIDYGSFADEYKGAPDEEILGDIAQTATVKLPRVFFTTDTANVYRQIATVTENERSAVAQGFQNGGEIVWITAQIDSKLEASRDHTEFWCDRLEMAALMCDFTNYRLWLVAPEGFTSEALSLLEQRNAYGSSRKQFELLRQFLDVPAPEREGFTGEEYEIVLPMGEDAELIAAHAVEEIAKRHNFDSQSINQIKTALVEACINAAEHSLSPDNKIYQKFVVGPDRIVITISNRGIRLADKGTPEPDPTEGRRGWGLVLMRRLMDEVTIEEVDDGTRISMTKYLKPEAA